MDLACLPALLRVTVSVLSLAELAQAGDAEAAERLTAVAELLSSNSLIASDNSGHVVPAGFTRITAFRTGFLQGAKTCTNQYP